MIKFAAICPHPPLLIPELGSEKDLKSVRETINAMNKLSEDFEDADIESIVLITGHNIVLNDRMCIFDSKEYVGNFGDFGHPEISMKTSSDNELIDDLVAASIKKGIPNIKFSEGKETARLDHGAMVPLNYLTKLTGNKIKLVLIGYSYLDKASHIKFGEMIAEVCNSNKYQNTNIAIVASGDMSHRLFSGAPAGVSDEGKQFDEMIVKDLANNDFDSIVHYDEDFIEAAGECGYRSILILLGALGNKYHCNVLSYEGPFGVGYLVAKFDLK